MPIVAFYTVVKCVYLNEDVQQKSSCTRVCGTFGHKVYGGAFLHVYAS